MDINKALEYLNNGEIEKGKKLLEELRKEYPQDETLLYNLGMAYSETGELEKSAETLEEALIYNPLNGNVLAALGFTYGKMEEFNKAINKLEYAVKAQPENIYILRNLAAIYGKIGDLDTAVKTFDKAVKIDPKNPEIQYGKAHALHHLGKLKESAEIYRNLIAREDISETVRRKAERDFETLKPKLNPKEDKDIRMDAVFYCLAALKKFKDMPIDRVRKIAFEVAYKGMNGIDISSPEQKYTLDNLEGNFSGFQMVCYEYVGFKMFEPTMDVGIDLSKEYESALQMFELEKGKDQVASEPSKENSKEVFYAENEVLDSVKKVIQAIEDNYGKPVVIEYKDNLNVIASTKIGFPGRDTHLIQLNKRLVTNLNHTLLHECGHIKRFIEASEDEQVVPVTSGQKLREVMSEVKKESEKLDIRVTDEIIQFWVEGLVQQLTSLAVDFRIETWIYQNFPEIWKGQVKSLNADAERTIQAASDRIQRITPPSIFTISNAINYAFLYKLFPITKKKYTKVYYDFPKVLAKGKRLVKIIPEADTGQHGDIELINAWSEVLGISDWFEWQKF